MNNIQSLRQKKGITQEKLAHELKLNRSTIAKWESGASLPRAEKLPELAKILGCTVDDLLKQP